MESFPDTSFYLFAGFLVIGIMLIGYILSLFFRDRRVEKETGFFSLANLSKVEKTGNHNAPDDVIIN